MSTKEPYKIIETSIGQIAIFGLTVRERINIEKELGTDFEKVDSTRYIKTLIKYICYKESSLDDSKTKTEKSPLNKTDIEALSDNDLESIAHVYVDNSSYLFRERISESKKNEDGIDQISIRYGEIEFPKNEDESYIDYLLRLEIEQNKKLRSAFENSFGKISSFSKSIQDSIRGTMSIGESLKNSINAIQSIKIPKVDPIITHYPKVDLKKYTDQISEMVQNPMNEVYFGIDQLIEINSESVKFMIEANKLQTRIAEEIKGSGNTSTRLSKQNILISLIVLLISLSSLGFSVYTVNESNKMNSIHIEKIISGLDKLNESITKDKEYLENNIEKINILEFQIDSLKRKNIEMSFDIEYLKNQIKNKVKENNKNAP